ncbi:YegS/Rv2252/BmrU family lipid kinase [Euzebya tangerina]|uniref:YegS/Rv2252/BmrU family lipid kinase n=1 Tax=Euzebya tangerina TaxID=591198 RepID=UPI0013C2E44F|nr:YegS/Rv2252/BmrU family lipid kinase [Euzebya tangerina]
MDRLGWLRRQAGRGALAATRRSLWVATQGVRVAETLASSLDTDARHALRNRPQGEELDLTRDDGARVRVHLAGDSDGDVVVLTHGYGLTAASWNLVATPLVEQGFRVVTFDWRGHGDSINDDRHVTPDELVSDLRTVFERLDLDDVLLVAHSTGGFITLATLVEHPDFADRLRGIILVAALAGDLLDGAPAGDTDWQASRTSVPARLLRNTTLGLLLGGFAQGAGVSSAVSEELLDQFAHTDHDALATLIAALSSRSYYGRLHRIDVPAIVVVGGSDSTIPEGHGRSIANEMPNARLITVDGASHLLNWHRPQRIVDLVVDFDAAAGPPEEAPDCRTALVVLNPASGDHDADETQHAITEALGAANLDVEVRRTQGEGDARRWAAEAARERSHDVVVAVGGDGTVREVISGVTSAEGGVTVGIVPTGTANLLARALRIPIDDRRAAADVIAGGGARHLDVLHLVERDEHAVLMVDAGFDAKLVRDASRGVKDVLGSLTYILAGLRNTVGLEERDLELEVDGERRTIRGHSVLCLNVGRIGQSVIVDADIRPDDGRLHIGVVRRPTPWHVLTTAAGMAVLGQDAHPNTEWFSGRRVRLSAEPAMALQVDGDPAGQTPVAVEVLPSAVQVAVPEESGH